MAKKDLVAKYEAKMRQLVDSGSLEKHPDRALTPMEEMVEEWTNNVISSLQKEADNLAVKGTTTLGQSIQTEGVNRNGGTLQLTVKAPEYWKYFNYGVTGYGNPAPSSHYGTVVFESELDYQFNTMHPHPDMVEGIREWLPQTGIFGGLPREEYENEDGTPGPLMQAIARNILRRGLEPKPFVEIVFERDDVVDDFTRQLADVTQIVFNVLFKDQD